MTAEALALQPVEAAQRDGFARHLNSQRFLFLTGHALTGQLALSADDIASGDTTLRDMAQERMHTAPAEEAAMHITREPEPPTG